MDKSAVQALSEEEVRVLGIHSLSQNVPPILLREILADVAKPSRDGADPARMVQSLARKVGGIHATISVDYRQICLAELTSEATVPMDSCGILAEGAVVRRLPDGKHAMLVDQRALSSVVDAWQRGRFTPADLRWAQSWREASASFSRSNLLARLGRHRIILPRPSTVEDCLATVDELLARSTLQSVWMEYVLEELAVGPRLAGEVREQWFRRAPGFLQRFAPYTHFCLRAHLAVTSASRHRLIRWSSSTLLDAAYLYYLPFCEIFVSNDHIHERLGPGLLRPPQRFLTGRDLRIAIKPFVRKRRDPADLPDPEES